MWEKAFTEASGYCWDKKDGGPCPVKAGSLGELKTILDWSHITQCLLRPYFETENYPLVEWRELLPSFEIDLFEYKQLPGFSLVAFDRPLNSFQEIFQYDVLHPFLDWQKEDLIKDACVLESSVLAANLRLFQSRLPKMLHEDFERQFGASDICGLENYFDLLPFLLHLERAHILAKDSAGEYCLTGIYASLPSELDTELKRFGMKIGKFSPGNNLRYECNRLFVYQFLMEQHGFPIVSERRTSAALFARRLLRMGENFMVRVLGQSDRTITTLSSRFRNRRYPRIEKIALVQVDQRQTEAITLLKDQGFFVDEKKRVVILRVIYKQHDYNPKNIREDRAISVQAQEIIHPLTGRVLSHLNIIKDASSMILCLNDIVRGEFQGKITYKRQEIIQDTDSHEKRLKFLFSWLSKHQHRIIDYSDEFFAMIVKVMDSYLLSPENYKVFNELNDLYQDVWSRYSVIQQGRKIRILEDLKNRQYKGKGLSHLEAIRQMTEILGELKFEIVNYFDQLVVKALAIGRQVVDDPYLQRRYMRRPDDSLSDYGRAVKKYCGRLVSLLDEFEAIRKTRVGEDMTVGIDVVL